MRPGWLLVLLALGEPAVAGGLVTPSGSPRAIGRAGTTVVGDDGAGALLANPAGIARRGGVRAQVGVAFVDDELAWQSPSEGAPLARDQAPSSIAPFGAAFGSAGAWVFGLGVMTSSISQRSFRPPRDINDPANVGVAFDYRYLGIAGAVRRDAVTLGVARRLGDSVAVGIALAAARVELAEIRRLWAGFSGRDEIGSPLQDLEVGFSGVDRFVPGVTAGVLVAPEGTALELGASVTWSGAANLDAEVVAAGTRPRGPSVSAVDPFASMTLEQPVIARAGGRYLAERLVVELGGELAIAPRRAADAEWTVLGMRVVDFTGVDVPLEQVPSRVSLRTHGAIRGAADVEISPGFLWVTAGYAYSVASVGATKQSPSFGDLGGHTLALGLEATSGGVTLTVGWSRTWALARSAPSAFALDNPFQAGDAPALTGVFDGSSDQLGIVLDAELDAP